jgi:hypothetical protein
MECKRPITRKYWGNRVIYRQAEYGVMQIFRPHTQLVHHHRADQSNNVTQPKEERGATRHAPTKQGERQGESCVLITPWKRRVCAPDAVNCKVRSNFQVTMRVETEDKHTQERIKIGVIVPDRCRPPPDSMIQHHKFTVKGPHQDPGFA